jgi:hypothetical protein
MWGSQEEMEADMAKGKWYAAIFAFTSVNLFVSLILTINTSPGQIPDETEWDMPSATQN